jgi:hypothetical protein
MPRSIRESLESQPLSGLVSDPIREVSIHDEEFCDEALKHDADHGEVDEGGDGSGVTLEIAC